jgi:hypothetical protein
MGFIETSGKASHAVLRHAKLSYNVSVSGGHSDDPDCSDEDAVHQANYWPGDSTMHYTLEAR